MREICAGDDGAEVLIKQPGFGTCKRQGNLDFAVRHAGRDGCGSQPRASGVCIHHEDAHTIGSEEIPRPHDVNSGTRPPHVAPAAMVGLDR
jgi:hypothetical protein